MYDYITTKMKNCKLIDGNTAEELRVLFQKFKKVLKLTKKVGFRILKLLINLLIVGMEFVSMFHEF